MELWYTEKQTENVGITCKVKGTLYSKQSQYQKINVIDTYQFGTMLVLDGTVQTTLVDEYIYHEMITHVPLNTHLDPKNVLVIGGGDGGSIREILKHKSVEKAVLVEIDKHVVEASKQFLPEISCALTDERCQVLVEDGIEYIRNHKDMYDVIIVDSTDPVGPAVNLFSKDFYISIYEALKDDGIFVAQTESPFYNQDLIRRVFSDIKGVFPITELYCASIPTYPSGYWSFTMGSKKYHPLNVQMDKAASLETRYYNAEIHKASFVLPNFVKTLLKG